MRRAQSAIEYLITYGWAVLIILVAVSFLYFYVLQPTLLASGTCSFSVQIACRDIALGANTAAGTANLIVVLGNAQQYPLQNPQIFADINGTNTSKVACSPGFVPAGGDMICQLGLSMKLSLNSFLAGKLYLNASNCGFGANYSAILSCTSSIKQTYIGVFTAHAQLAASNAPVTLSLTSSNGASAAGVNTIITLYATVKLLSNPLSGAVVNFTENSGVPTIRPQYATSSSTGVAISTIKSPSPLSVTVAANSFSVSNSLLIVFVSITTTILPYSTTLASSTTFGSTTVSSTSVSSTSVSSTSLSTTTTGGACSLTITSNLIETATASATISYTMYGGGGGGAYDGSSFTGTSGALTAGSFSITAGQTLTVYVGGGGGGGGNAAGGAGGSGYYGGGGGGGNNGGGGGGGGGGSSAILVAGVLQASANGGSGATDSVSGGGGGGTSSAGGAAGSGGIDTTAGSANAGGNGGIYSGYTAYAVGGSAGNGGGCSGGSGCYGGGGGGYGGGGGGGSNSSPPPGAGGSNGAAGGSSSGSGGAGGDSGTGGTGVSPYAGAGGAGGSAALSWTGSSGCPV